MASNTNKSLKNKVIYSVYVRNHSESGDFKGVMKDLDRIKLLGVDYIWFMPIHPIGEVNKKGELGCPYSISDYRAVNPEYGTMEDFKELVSAIHEKGMKCMIDVVYNHTSHESVLSKEHPEFFYKKPDGRFGNKVGDWTDVIDLDYTNKDLWDYQLETLKMWAKIVDGFRCDVASLVPIEFWNRARKEVAEVNPDCLWLAESVEYGLIKYARDTGFNCLSDSELYQAFDILYDYDVYPKYLAYVDGEIPLSEYINALNQQEYIYPENYIKLRCLENHDRARAKKLVVTEQEVINYTAFMYMLKGTVLLYAGQETENTNTPSLFDYDKVDWNTGFDLTPILHNLYRVKQSEVITNGTYELKAYDSENAVTITYKSDKGIVFGAFSMRCYECIVEAEVPDGEYKNKINGKSVFVKNGEIELDGFPVIIEF